MHETMIAYPSVTTCLLLGKRLLNSGHNLTLFCPNAVFRQMAGTVPLDLKIAALNLDTTVQVEEDLTSIARIDFVIFPTVDFLPEMSRSQFAEMCQTHFR